MIDLIDTFRLIYEKDGSEGKEESSKLMWAIYLTYDYFSKFAHLGLEQRIAQSLTQLLPAVGQGAVGIEARSNDTELLALLAPLHHLPTAICVQAERAMNRRLQGGCQVPIAGFATLVHQQLSLKALVGSVDGQSILQAQAQTTNLQAIEQFGESVAEDLLAQGADKILAAVYG